jgi:hypothetical protein
MIISPVCGMPIAARRLGSDPRPGNAITAACP